MTAIEIGQRALIVEARAATAVAASGAVTSTVIDLARRIGALEQQVLTLRPALPGPQ